MAMSGKEPNVGKIIPNVTIKQEEDLLGEDWRTPETVNLELVKEEKHSHSVVELDAVQQFSPMPQTHEYIKTELILDEPLDDQSNSNSASESQEYNQHLLEIGEYQQARISRAGEDSETSGLCRNTYPKEVLATHMSHMRGKRTYQCEVCEVCPQSFVDQIDLKRHSTIHDDNRVRNYVCGRCNFKCLDINGLKNHLNAHHPEDRPPEFACDLCEKRFYTKNALKKHVNLHTEDTYNCRKCGIRFPIKTRLKVHMLRWHSDKKSSKNQRYQCKYCDKDYGNRYLLFEHNKEHTGFPWKCSICEKKFTNRKSCRAHITGVHRIIDKETVNEFTLKVPTSKEVPKEIQPSQPIKTELEEKSETHKVQPFTPETQIANDPYERTKTDLALNEEFLDDKTASDSKMDAEQVAGLNIEDKNIETCKLCHNIYRKEFMEAHMREVHCAKRYQCKHCPRSFNRIDNLTRHITCHDDNRPRKYPCRKCGSKFLDKHTLERHLLTHEQGSTSSKMSSEKERYKCQLCEKHYGSKKSLQVHYKVHTGLPWKCTICTKKFTLRDKCRRHISNAHKITDKEAAKAFVLNIPTAKDL